MGRIYRVRIDMSACSAAKEAFTVIDYEGVKKRHSGADAFIKVFFEILLISIVGRIFFLTFIYYVQHRGRRVSPCCPARIWVHESEAAHGGGTLT